MYIAGVRTHQRMQPYQDKQNDLSKTFQHMDQHIWRNCGLAIQIFGGSYDVPQVNGKYVAERRYSVRKLQFMFINTG